VLGDLEATLVVLQRVAHHEAVEGGDDLLAAAHREDHGVPVAASW
jgi:hypothetical protein